MKSFLSVRRNTDRINLTFNRPEKRNALSPELVSQLYQKLHEIEEDESIKAVLISGSGKAFCAGADLAYLEKLSHFSDEENLRDSRELAGLFEKIYRLPKITMAVLNGPALAGGCGLALCCDYRFADEKNALLGFTETRIGFVPAIVMNFLIRKVDLNTAYKLVLGAEVVTAQTAFQYGLVDKLSDPSSLIEESHSFLDALLSQNSLNAMLQTKSLFQNLLDLPLSSGIDRASEINALSRKTTDCKRGLKMFLNKQKIDWRKS